MKLAKDIKFLLETSKEVAYDSPDHLHPLGTSRDNSINKRFNEKIYSIFGSYPRPVKVMDMGCSGGGFVKSCIDDGCIGIGIEGSDYSKKLKRAEWKTIPDKLFTSDITVPFQVKMDNGGDVFDLKFDVVTSWEVMEHIKESDLQTVAENVKKHLLPHGLWIMSVSQVDDWFEGVNLHQTVQNKKWWISKFREFGLEHLPQFEGYFNHQYIRGNRYLAPGSFHLILSKDPANAPKVPPYKFSARLYDSWRGTRLHRLFNKLVDL
jgi:2-polyprenyl-3-methyl-5-hydroxy-6-metoxy-1,4-benzoquinol methylase